ncbi:MAG: transposase, partial [Candidatus Kapaibacterium sp.]
VEMAMVETAMVETGNVEMQNVEMQNVETEMVETAMVETGNVETQNVNTQNVETRLIESLPNQTETNGGFAGNKNPMIHENISRIIRWYKGRCSYELRKIHADFGWQSRFHDHIIRDEQSYQNISHYIINNPAKWAKDTFYG